MSFNMSFRVPFVMPFDDIPPEHVLGRLLRYPLISELRKELERAKREAELEEVTERMLEENTMEQIISNRMQYNFNLIVYDYSIHYMAKSNTNARRNDDIFYIYPINDDEWIMGDSALGKIRIFGGLLGRSPIKPNEVQFKVQDLRGGNWFTVGPSRRKQQLNRNRSTAALMAVANPTTAHFMRMPPIDPYIAGGLVAQMLGADGNAVTDAANARDAAAYEEATVARIARLPEPESHWSNNVNLSSIKLRKSRKRTRKVRTRRH